MFGISAFLLLCKSKESKKIRMMHNLSNIGFCSIFSSRFVEVCMILDIMATTLVLGIATNYMEVPLISMI